jgi:branched-chain amino acid transport system ATP-binding protein
MTSLLEIRSLNAWYGNVQVLHGIDFDVPQGGVTTLIGANGAGKTSTLRAICNAMVRREGSIRFAGKAIDRLGTHEVIKLGMAHVPDGRGTFAPLSVEQNLQLGGHSLPNRNAVHDEMKKVYALFPKLKEREHQQAGTLSGGEQQMLAVGRALMSRPKLILLDEPSFGLAPLIVKSIFETLRQITLGQGVSVLLVEQNVNLALALADQACLIESGRVVKACGAKEMRSDETVKRVYLGL